MSEPAPELAREACAYQAYYCEENVWQLCQHPALAGLERTAVFVTNAWRTCAMWLQRAATAPHLPIVWDYHVVLHTAATDRQPALIWDLDTLLDFPTPAATWLDHTFAGTSHVRHTYQPRFRLIPSARYIAAFASDRSHMRDASGAWLQPPPPWPAIQPPAPELPLARILELEAPIAADERILDLAGAVAALS